VTCFYGSVGDVVVPAVVVAEARGRIVGKWSAGNAVSAEKKQVAFLVGLQFAEVDIFSTELSGIELIFLSAVLLLTLDRARSRVDLELLAIGPNKVRIAALAWNCPGISRVSSKLYQADFLLATWTVHRIRALSAFSSATTSPAAL
jgi:hypothetical protein